MPIDIGSGDTTFTPPKKGKSRIRKPTVKKTIRRTGGGGNNGSSGGYHPPRRTIRNGGGSSSNNNRSSGNGGGGGGGGGGYKPPKVKPRPKPPSINDYLGGDSTYQGVVRGGKRSLTDYLSELNRRRGEATTQYTQTQGSMERDRVSQLDGLRQEFASRGLIQSGLFGEEQGKFQQQFTDQSTALSQQQAALLADLLGQQKNFQREQDLALEQAKQEALLRRSQKYKIGA